MKYWLFNFWLTWWGFIICLILSLCLRNCLICFILLTGWRIGIDNYNYLSGILILLILSIIWRLWIILSTAISLHCLFLRYFLTLILISCIWRISCVKCRIRGEVPLSLISNFTWIRLIILCATITDCLVLLSRIGWWWINIKWWYLFCRIGTSCLFLGRINNY